MLDFVEFAYLKMYNLESYSVRVCVTGMVSLKLSKGLYIAFHLAGLGCEEFKMKMSELPLRFLCMI